MRSLGTPWWTSAISTTKEGDRVVANVFLVCEGPANGLDQRVLDALVIQMHGLRAQVIATGGDRGLGSVRAYLHHPPRAIALSIEDRNYRPGPEAEQTWANP